MRLGKPLRSGDDHGPDGVGAHGVAVVEDFDATGQLAEVEHFCEAFQKTALGRRFGQRAAERVLGVHERAGDQFAFLAAPRYHHRNTAPDAFAQRLGQQRPLRDVVR